METTSKHETVETVEFLTKANPELNGERIKVLFALCELTGQDLKKAIGILTSHSNLITNIQTAATWEAVRQSALSFADQVASMFPMPDEEVALAERRVKELTELKPEEAEAYFTDLNNYCYYLFPELKIAFCLNADHVKLLRLPYPGEYQLS